MNNEIILYQSAELSTRIGVRVEAETVWLNRQQISMLFDRDVKTIGKHINNVFSEGELNKKATVANFAIVQIEGGRKVERLEKLNQIAIHQMKILLDDKSDRMLEGEI